MKCDNNVIYKIVKLIIITLLLTTLSSCSIYVEDGQIPTGEDLGVYFFPTYMALLLGIVCTWAGLAGPSIKSSKSYNINGNNYTVREYNDDGVLFPKINDLAEDFNIFLRVILGVLSYQLIILAIGGINLALDVLLLCLTTFIAFKIDPHYRWLSKLSKMIIILCFIVVPIAIIGGFFYFIATL